MGKPKTMETNRIKILFVEDIQEDAEMAQWEIRKEMEFDYLLVDTEEKFREALSSFSPEIIISDYSMPGFDGMTALNIAREKVPDTPFVVLTGSMNEETAVACMKAGATDYVIKEQITRLPFAVREALEKFKEKMERKKLMQKLKDSEMHYRTSFEESRDAILILTEEGKIIDFNSRMVELSDYKHKEFISLKVSDLLPGFCAESVFQGNSNSGKNEASPYFETYVKTRRRKVIPVEISFSLLHNYSDKSTVIQANIRDITERKKAENELLIALERAKEADRLKTAFLANMSHEIRTPMNGIMGFISLICRPGVDEQKRKDYANVIHKSSKRLLGTINDMIDIAKIEAGQVKVVFNRAGLNSLLYDIRDFFSAEAGEKGLSLKLYTELSDEDSFLATDSEKLYAILANLVKNAIKFTQEGEVSVGYTRVEDPGGLRVEVFVRDTGIGIPLERQEAIFNRFEQADIEDKRAFEGSGLGLSISRAYCELLGGSIRVDSTPGEGSVFTVSLPWEKAKGDKPGVPVIEKEDVIEIKKSSGLNILVAEDDEICKEYLKTLLKNTASSLKFVKTGQEVVEECRRNGGIDMIFMDIKMPGMDGYEATREIRKFNSEIIIIAQTAYALKGDRTKALEAGCDEYLSKPLDEGEVMGVIRKFGGGSS